MSGDVTTGDLRMLANRDSLEDRVDAEYLQRYEN